MHAQAAFERLLKAAPEGMIRLVALDIERHPAHL
jgi:hypothetical protein